MRARLPPLAAFTVQAHECTIYSGSGARRLHLPHFIVHSGCLADAGRQKIDASFAQASSKVTLESIFGQSTFLNASIEYAYMSDNDRLLNITDKDILLLKIFEAVVKAGGYTAAEACLNKSKSAISIHISTLETRLGKTLCHRGRSGFSLTPEGEQVYQVCKDLFSDLNVYRERLNRVSSIMGGVITVALDDTLYGRIPALERVFERFNSTTSNTFLELYITSPERLLQMLLDGTADIGIGAIPREIAGVEMHVLYEEPLALYCGDKHPLFTMQDRDITTTLLDKYQAVDFWAYQEPGIEDAMNSLRMTARSGQAMARLLLILSGKWISFLPRDFAADWVALGRLREIHRPGENVIQKCYAAARNDVASSRLCAQMMSELQRAFAEVG